MHPITFRSQTTCNYIPDESGTSIRVATPLNLASVHYSIPPELRKLPLFASDVWDCIVKASAPLENQRCGRCGLLFYRAAYRFQSKINLQRLPGYRRHRNIMRLSARIQFVYLLTRQHNGDSMWVFKKFSCWHSLIIHYRLLIFNTL